MAVPTDIRALFAMLEARQLRYVVVGGLALVLHGVDRLTADVDIAMDLAPDAAARLVAALTETGYRPMAPVDAKLLAEPDVRAGWHRDRNMQVFSFWDSTGRRPTIDVASISHLIRLKELAGRAQDLADIKRLRAIASKKES